jgi:Uma2 family endonuclease
MSTLPKTFLTEEQYLEIERAAEFKSEYFDGQMYAMSGAREAHNLISGNLFTSLRQQTRPRGCRAFINDMRVRVSGRMYTYPDVVVACGERKFLDGRRDTLLNPTLICEVLSESTERYDRGRKFRHYQGIESLRQYVLVSTDQMSVEVFTRQSDDSWVLRTAENPTDTVELESIGCKLTLAEVYEDVEFDAEATA